MQKILWAIGLSLLALISFATPGSSLGLVAGTSIPAAIVADSTVPVFGTDKIDPIQVRIQFSALGGNCSAQMPIKNVDLATVRAYFDTAYITCGNTSIVIKGYLVANDSVVGVPVDLTPAGLNIFAKISSQPVTLFIQSVEAELEAPSIK